MERLPIPKWTDLPTEVPFALINSASHPEPGIYPDVPDSTYFSWDCFQKSAISSINKSAKHYWEYRSSQFTSKAMNEGKLLECLLLEPHLFDRYFVVPPPTFTRPIKVTRAKPLGGFETLDWAFTYDYCQKWKKGHEINGKIVVTQRDIDVVIESIKVIATRKNVTDLLGGKKQVALVWEDPVTKVMCKARLDILNDIDDMNICDLKKTKDASWSDTGDGGFKREILTYDYHGQGAFYSDGYEVLTGNRIPFIFIAVEIVPPYECATYALRNDSLLQGRVNYKKGLYKYQEMILGGVKSGYAQKIIDLDIPAYALKNTDFIDDKYMQLGEFE